MNKKRYEKLLKEIDTKERELKKLKDNISWIKKEIGKTKIGYLGYLKGYSLDLIKTIDKYYKTRAKLYDLYNEQNKGV